MACKSCHVPKPKAGDFYSMRTRPPRFEQGGSRLGTRGYDPGRLITPTADNKGNRIYSGRRSDLGSFSDSFVDEFLKAYYAQGSRNNRKNLKTRQNQGTQVIEYQCFKCGQFFPRKVSCPGAGNWISLAARGSSRSLINQ
jgi:hypothetical protein